MGVGAGLQEREVDLDAQPCALYVFIFSSFFSYMVIVIVLFSIPMAIPTRIHLHFASEFSASELASECRLPNNLHRVLLLLCPKRCDLPWPLRDQFPPPLYPRLRLHPLW